MPDVRLIDANALKSKMTVSALGGHKRIFVCGVIDDAPTVDAQPVKHGHWVELPKALNPNELPCQCSNCKHVVSFYYGYPKSKFCDECSAKMDGDADGNEND